MVDVLHTAPAFELTAEDVDGLRGLLGEYQQEYASLFPREEHRIRMAEYMEGLLSNSRAKSAEPMMLARYGGDLNAVRSMQHFLSEAKWEDKPVLLRHWGSVDRFIGSHRGVIIADGSDFHKQGRHSVGVKRQYCGELGKTANCQAGVFIAYASPRGYALLHARLYMPKDWLSDQNFEERREKARVPKDISFKTKPEIAADMIEEIALAGNLRARWVAADEAFGSDPEFLDRVTKLGLWYFTEVRKNTCFWMQRPRTAVPEWSGKGRKPEVERVVNGEPVAMPAEAIQAELGPTVWKQYNVKEGTKGTIIADFAAVRVVNVREGMPGEEVWLVLRRDFTTREVKYFVSNAPAKLPLKHLARISGMRWPIETSFEQAKQLVGMGHYEVRSWRGWHHHMTMAILAYFFLIRAKLKLKGALHA